MPYRLRLSVADLPFELVTMHRSTARTLETYFHDYRTDAVPGFSISIQSGRRQPNRTCSSRVVPELEPGTAGEYRIINNNTERVVIGHIDEPSGTCRLTDRVCLDTYLLSSAVRVCTQFHLERNGGFFLHGACGAIGRKGVLFTGKSTAGKSTALHNLQPDRIVAEDATALRITGGNVRVYAIPFRGERPSHTVLSALCFPRKSTEPPRLIREGTAAVATELTANALFSAPASETHMSTVLSTIINCSTAVPGYNCYFDKSTNLYGVFAEHGLFN